MSGVTFHYGFSTTKLFQFFFLCVADNFTFFKLMKCKTISGHMQLLQLGFALQLWNGHLLFLLYLQVCAAVCVLCYNFWAVVQVGKQLDIICHGRFKLPKRIS